LSIPGIIAGCDLFTVSLADYLAESEYATVDNAPYVHVAPVSGNDANSGWSRKDPVQTIRRALEIWDGEDPSSYDRARILLLEDIGSGYPDTTLDILLVFDTSGLTDVYDIVLEGAGRGGKRIDAASTNKRVVDVPLQTGEAITLRKLTISGGSSSQGAGIRVANGTLYLENNVVITSNSATNGGGVYVVGGKLVMRSGSIHHNYSGNDGGGLMVFGGTAEIENGSIEYNRATYGGGIYLGNGTVTLGTAGGTHLYPYIQYNTTTTPGTATGGGMTINGSGTMTFHHGTVRGNHTEGKGGGIQIVQGTLDMRGGTVTNNTAGDYAPGIWLENGLFSMSANARVLDPANPVYLDNVVAVGGNMITLDTGGFTYIGDIAVIDVHGATSITTNSHRVLTGSAVVTYHDRFHTINPDKSIDVNGYIVP
jgi:hypothetical protein